ncbi:hypothetical protein F2P56_001496 [Juglans regia]|uniref:Retrotransposon Copia-like N-terminal domain-containing protein n=1 Tax=Juglans regia TaxID=51240 RepID=A0A833YF78_JUGRE|nr:hypothetical protein F2P56_001496 [Juglans regia]
MAEASPPPTSSSSLPHLSHLVTVKLTHENYLLWRTQMVPYLRGQDLFHFVDGSSKPPSRFLSDKTTINPTFLAWTKTDQMILSAIISTLSDNLIAQMVGHSTSQAAWSAIEKLFSSQSHARVTQLRYQLATISKGASSVSDYFRKLKHLSDTMCAAGTPLSSDEFTSYLLAGLNSDYDALVMSITARLEPMAPEELYSLLLTYESRLAHSTHLPASTILSANYTSGPPNHTNRGRGNYRGHNRAPFRGRGRGRHSSSQTSANTFAPSPLPHGKPICQVCGKVGHSAIKCYFRFDHAYQSEPPRNLTANYSSSSASPDSSWYPDTAATNHITSDMSNLNLTSGPYGGNEQIRIGDGTELPIANIGFNDGNPSPSWSHA